MTPRSSNGICFDWQNGTCSKSNCKFSHDNGPTNQNQQGSAMCPQWQATGTCSFGYACRFHHSGGSSIAASFSTSNNNPNNTSTTATATTTSSNNTSTKSFLKHLDHIKHTTQFSRELAQSSQLWLRCWQDYMTLDKDGLRMLVESLARVPGSLIIQPPPMKVIEGAFMAYLANQGSSSVSNETLLTQGKTTLAAVTRLLQFEWYPPKGAIQESLANIALKAEGIMRKKNKEHRIVSMDLMALVERIEQARTIKIRELVICQDVVEAKSEPVSYTDWKTANVKWLCNPKHFAPSSCPKMKVGSEGVYNSSEEYIKTIYRLWIAMTFADGHAAFGPHCRTHTQTGTNCNSSLWPLPKSAQTNSMHCRTKECRRPVEFGCCVAGHDALCHDCAMRSIEKHKKGPAAGMNASTHIYDCRVQQVGKDGILYLTEFESRNPPIEPIDWRTTNRLSPPNLVGVVKTRTKGADLQDGDLIKWGECTYHGDSRSEGSRRNNGELVINLSNIVEFDPEFFEEGSYVAVIDCMTKWIPVLKALESQQQFKVPFEDGKYLNLLKHSAVKLNNFWNDASLKDVTSTKNWETLELMVDNSTLEPIREIRRHADLRDELLSRLDALVTQATLDRCQLISFVDSLQHPVHLTQGPQGTGKTYLGVVLVRALLIIRDIWLKKATYPTPPPILFLSYKKHTMDEFLVELIKAEPHAMQNRLIRLGGQCKDERLSMYSERSLWQSNLDVIDSRKRLQDLQLLCSSIRQTVDGDIASFLAHRQSFRTDNDAKKQHKETIEATNRLMEMMARRILLNQALKELKKKGGDCTKPTEVIAQLSFLKVTEDNREDKRHASDIQQLCQKVDKNKMIPLLCHGLQHYETHQNWGDVLLMFLSGKIPLPPCEFVVEEGKTCGRQALDPNVPLCDDHRCCQRTGMTRCTLSCQSQNGGCEAHVCDVTGCREVRFDVQKFCFRHCCRQCLTLKLDVCQRAVEPPPRNVCKEHSLCVFPCLALTKKGHPCRTPPISSLMPYCMAHQHLHKMLDSASDSDDDNEEDRTEKNKVVQRQRCAAITKKRRSCNRNALTGKRHCHCHDFSTEGALAGADIPGPKTNKDVEEIDADLEPEAEEMDCNKSSSFHSGISVQTKSTQGNVPNVDEADRQELDEMELEEGENVQHLRDVTEVAEEKKGEDFESEEDDAEEEFSNSDDRSESSTVHELIDSKTWSWTMNEDDRWAACQSLLSDLRRSMARASRIVKSSIVVAREEHQQAIILAKAEVCDNKSVIGGTMMACVSHLESIRATRPFAVVVQEASEVLEPMLFSCLTESTIKLEMIGDHRRLHPPVMNRYEFELHNKINISMFQRLSEAPPGHQIPSTVLSIQKRKRPYAASFHECRKKIQLTRLCGHIETIRCSDSRKPLHPCKISVPTTSPLCGHDISVPCGLKYSLEKLTFWDDKTTRSVTLDKRIPSTSELLLDTNDIGSDKIEALLSCPGDLLMTLPCGHEVSVKCAEIFENMINRNKMGLSDEATVTLGCGHGVSTTCINPQCVATSNPQHIKRNRSKMHPCWNFESCGNKVALSSSLEGSIACDAISEWVCPRGTHAFNIPICSKGVPNVCPHCCIEELEGHLIIREDHPIRDMIKSIFSKFGVTVPAQDDDGVSRIKQLLQEHIDIQRGIPLWQRTLLQMQLVPCMCVVNEHATNEFSFHPSTFVKKKTLNGLTTKLLTPCNVEKMLNRRNKGPLKLLVGVAAVVKCKDLRMSRLPTKAPEKSSFLQNLWSDAYDSVLYLSPQGDEELVQRDPCALQAMLVAELDKNDIKKLAQKLSEVPLMALKDEIEMSFGVPTDLVRINTGHAGGFHDIDDDDHDDGDGDQSADQNDKSIALQQSLVGTPLEPFVVDIDWKGGIGVLDGNDRNIEKDLLTKMKFVNCAAKPFQAIKQIDNLLTKSPELHILHLLLSAECVLHSSLDRAKDELESYLQKGQNSAVDFRIHPWTLVILARLDSTHSKLLLSTFVNHFSLFTDILSDDEHALIKNVVPSTGNNITRSWSDNLKDSWQELKDKNDVESSAMDELLELTGLKKVKEEALLLWKAALQLERMDDATRKENPIVANYCFLGNPGTGKTTVARLFAAILCDCGVRARNVFEETTAQEAKDAGTAGFRNKVAKAVGGVLFIDDAYDLNPIGDPNGKPIVNEILTLCENRRDEISVILAGYEDHFEMKFFNYNAGLRSRFKCVTFEDFDSNELALIWTGMRSKKKWQEEEGVTQVVVKRLSKLVGKKGFGNAREVRVRLEKATQIALVRLGDNFSHSNMMISVSDVIGEDPRLSNEKLVNVRHQIDSKIGWERIKAQVDQLVNVCGINYGRELRGEKPLDIFLNRMFLGNPGTGKTTCAKLYGGLLKELGFLSSGDVVFKTASDFIGRHSGESQQITNQILDGARGKVLIIDEAYALNDGSYGQQVLDTLVEKVQGGPSDDIAVILIGYEERMTEMLRKQNPGLARRFPKEQAFYFDDYDESQLLAILDMNLRSNQVEASMAFRQKALDVLGIQKLQANFGNAGAVETLIKGAMVKAAERCTTRARIVLEAMDILDPGSERSEKNEDPLAVLDTLHRMEQVKSKLEEMRRTWEVSRREGDERPSIGHFVFTGSPGTGKTTVARAIANILFSLGLLPTDIFVETSALELQANYVGQTSTKVDNALQAAKGGLLFIDEAYNLGQGPFGKEACDSLVGGMTSDKFRDVVIVIAGYADEIHEMLQSNSGLKSRLTYFFDFPDWNPQDCVSFFKMLCGKKCFETEDGVMDIIYRGCSQLIKLEGWANGRDVKKLWESAKRCRDVRVYEEPTAEKTLTIVDVEAAIKEMQSARASRTRKEGQRPYNQTYNMPLFDLAHAQAPRRHLELGPPANAMDVKEVDDEASPQEETVLEEGRDPGVTDAVWGELKESKKLAAKKEQEYQECQNRLCTIENLANDLQRRKCEQEQKLKELLEQLASENDKAERQRIEEERILLEDKLMELKEEESRLEAEQGNVEDKARRLEEEKRKEAETLRKIQTILPCPMGYAWFRSGQGWCCEGGGHQVSDEELRARFGSND